MMHKKGSFLITAGLLLIAAALVICVYNYYDAYKAWKASMDTATQLAQMITEEIASQPQDIPQTPQQSDVPGIEIPIFVPTIPDYLRYPEMEMPVKIINDREYIGILDIPVLNLSLPVMSTWSYPDLQISPCRYVGSVYLDNMVIAAHNYQTHFGRLKELNSGDEIIFTDVDGNIFRYTVAYQEQLQKTDVEEMQTGDWDLTLFTCTVGGAMRVTIRCDRVQEDIWG